MLTYSIDAHRQGVSFSNSYKRSFDLFRNAIQNENLHEDKKAHLFYQTVGLGITDHLSSDQSILAE